MTKHAVYYNYKIKKRDIETQLVDRFDSYEEAYEYYKKKVDSFSLVHTMWHMCRCSLAEVDDSGKATKFFGIKDIGESGKQNPEWLL